jgi:hypothetical protein
MSPAECSCGAAHPHRIAGRKTFDGAHVWAWSDGPITGPIGEALRGVPIVRPRTAEQVEVALRVAWAVMGEVELFELAALPALYAAARKAAARETDPAEVRRRMMALLDRPRFIKLVWADLGGGVRRARLPRLMWPGTWVEHSSSRGYEVLYEVTGTFGMLAARGRSTTLVTSGIRFRTRAELDAHLHLTREAVR